MLFNSLHFFYFFILVTSIYYVLPHRYRWFLLLTASCYFYMVFKPVYILILLATILIDYLAGIWIERSQGKQRRVWLILSLVANIGVLCFFKYYNFINDNITAVLASVHTQNPVPYLTMLLPIGLSFHTFQAMSYTIEVYRGNQKAERHLGIYALYVMFYPQLVAGPIERPQNVLWQFHQKHPFQLSNLGAGLEMILWGLFKKVVLADRLAMLVNPVYNDPQHQPPLVLLIATLAFALQIYFDFSGYSDIALGTARTLGYSLMVNFRRPYLSTSVAEFWTRWHISLSTWFRDYFYIPLGGNRVSVPRWYGNLLFTFLLSGLWHGPAWTYVIWGGLNGLYLIGENITRPITKHISLTIRQPLGWLLTICLICVSWIFFRANSFSDATYILTHLLPVDRSEIASLRGILSKYDLVVLVAGLLFIFLSEIIQENPKLSRRFVPHSQPLRLASYYLLALFILLFGLFSVQEQFIYFQF
ncbi:MBOAT family O-acyltransferase [Spirosoma sp.]|uniref:MBOAT family O-acyltransferase n=1 Tax=Spirosoma sp. TaxID=1899569 RepID=UPI003B3A6722